MDDNNQFNLPRRSFLAAAGAFGAATMAFPGMSISADGKVLTVSLIRICKSLIRLSAYLPEEDIIRSIYAPMVVVEPGDDGHGKPLRLRHRAA